MKALVVAAKNLAAKWSQLSFDEMRRVLGRFIHKIIVDHTNVQILFSRANLLNLLQNTDRRPEDCPKTTGTMSSSRDLVTLKLEAKRKRCGGEVHLVVSPNDEPTAVQPKLSLVKAVVRAHGWYQKVLEGSVLDQRGLARDAGLTERYVGKVFACAFLAPDIIDAILDGRQPRDLTFEKLTRNVPLSWVEQREQFGFARRP
jgi:hypothetical protein